MLVQNLIGRGAAAYGWLSDDRAGDCNLSLMLAALIIGIVIGIGSVIWRREPECASDAPDSPQPIDRLRPYGC